jgi:hypothetical protein
MVRALAGVKENPAISVDTVGLGTYDLEDLAE